MAVSLDPQFKVDALAATQDRKAAIERLNRAVASISDPEDRNRVATALAYFYGLDGQVWQAVEQLWQARSKP